MDVVWIIMDSVSYESTPFAQTGPETMPKLHSLSKNKGIIYTNAYAPGPTSPSSHGSFLTGKLPSETGMHEVDPYYRKKYPSIADKLPHRSLLISANPFITNGIDRDFDEVDDLRTNDYLLFEGASDPGSFMPTDGSGLSLSDLLRFAHQDGKPLRSIINGISHHFWRQQTDGLPTRLSDENEQYQYAQYINNNIQKFIDSSTSDTFVLANYMTAHPPLDASDEALNKFFEHTKEGEIPIGKIESDVQTESISWESFFNLYHAAIWDLDRKVVPLIESLLDSESVVIITSDHGNWLDRKQYLEEKRIHVPLIVFFPPYEGGEICSKSVNLRSLPSSTMDILNMNNPFDGDSIIGIEDNKLSITEHIYNKSSANEQNMIAHSSGNLSIKRNMVIIKGQDRIDIQSNNNYDVIKNEDGYTSELINVGKDLITKPLEINGGDDIGYDEETEQRLKDLGYIQ